MATPDRLDDYRRADPAYRLRVAHRMLRKAALQPGTKPEDRPTWSAQQRAVRHAVEALQGVRV